MAQAAATTRCCFAAVVVVVVVVAAAAAEPARGFQAEASSPARSLIGFAEAQADAAEIGTAATRARNHAAGLPPPTEDAHAHLRAAGALSASGPGYMRPGGARGAAALVGGRCDAETYRASLLLWSCEFPTGQARIKVKAREVLPVLKVPIGVRGLSIQLHENPAAASATLQMSDMQGDVIVGTGAQINSLAPGSFRGMDIVVTDDGGGSKDLAVGGETTSSMILSIDNRDGAEEHQVMLVIAHQGLGTCPTTPIGCKPLDASVAQESVHAWSCKMRTEFPSAHEAWEVEGAPLVRGVGIPWDVFGQVWDAAMGDKSSSRETKWMLAFKQLDHDLDNSISQKEFEEGFQTCAPAQRSAPVSMPHPDMSGLNALGDALVPACAWLAGGVVLVLLLVVTIRTVQARCSGSIDYRDLATFQRVPAGEMHRTVTKHSHRDYSPEDPHGPLQAAAQNLATPPDRQERTCGTWFDCGWRSKPPTAESSSPAPAMHRRPPQELDERMRQLQLRDQEQKGIMEQQQRQIEELKVARAAAVQREYERRKGERHERREAERRVTAAEQHAAAAEQHAAAAQQHAAAQQRAAAAQQHAAAQQRSAVAQHHEHHAHQAVEAFSPTAPADYHHAHYKEEMEMHHDAQQQQNHMQVALDELRNHPDVRGRTHACSELAGLLTTDRQRADAIQMGVPRAIVHAMTVASDHIPMQKAGCLALNQLCQSVEENDLAVQVAEVGGMEVVLQSMRNHAGEADVQEAGLRALRHLSLHSRNRVRLCRDRGLEQIRQAMHGHRSSEIVQECGCLAIGNLVFEQEAANHIDMDLVQAIIDGMDEHLASVRVVEAGVFALYNVICTANNFDTVRQCGGVDTVRRASHRHAEIRDSEEAQCIIEE